MFLKNKLWILLIVILVGLFLRSNVAYTTEIWGDESLSVDFSLTTSYKDLFFQTGQYTDFVHPSGYYLLLKFWMSFTPFTEASIRTLSLIFFIPSILLFYNIVYTVAKKNRKWLLQKKEDFKATRIALFSTFIFSIHPMMIHLGYQARMYAPAIFFNLLAIFFLLRKNEKNKFLNIFLSAFSCALAFYFDYLTIWFIFSFLTLFLYLYFKKTRKNCVKNIFSFLLVTFIFILPQLFLLLGFISKGLDLQPGSVPMNISFSYFLSQVMEMFGFFQADGVIALILFVIFILVISLKSKNNKIDFLKLLIPLLLLISIIISYKKPIFLARNLSLISIISCVLLAEQIEKFFSEKKWGLIFLVFPIILYYVVISITISHFYVQGDLNYFSKKVKNENAMVIFLPETHSYTLTAFHFKKYNVPKNNVVYLENNFGKKIDKLFISSPRKKYIVYSNFCGFSETCSQNKKLVSEYCTKKNNCDFFRPL